MINDLSPNDTLYKCPYDVRDSGIIVISTEYAKNNDRRWNLGFGILRSRSLIMGRLAMLVFRSLEPRVIWGVRVAIHSSIGVDSKDMFS